MRLLLFDIDGTLVNTRGAGRAALASALQTACGETGPIDGFDFYGRTDPAIARGLLRSAGWDDDRIEVALPAVWPAYYAQLEHELAERDGQVFTYPGVRDLLGTLEGDRRFAVGLVTGNMERGARSKLGACGLDGAFSFGAFGSDSERRENLPPIARRRAERRFNRPFDLEDAVVLGDTPEDIRCARSNGARVLAVATGRHTVAELETHGPDATVDDLTETGALIQWLAHE